MHDKLTNRRIHLNCPNLMAGGEAQTSPLVLPKNQKMKVTSTERTARGTAVLQNAGRFLCQQLRHSYNFQPSICIVQHRT
jgi:hypothetical protein